MIYTIHVYGTMWRIKNQPSNSISCSDNALRLLILVTGKLWELQGCLHFQIGVALGRAILREAYYEGPNHVWRAFKTSILNTGGGWGEEKVVWQRFLTTSAFRSRFSLLLGVAHVTGHLKLQFLDPTCTNHKVNTQILPLYILKSALPKLGIQVDLNLFWR